MTDYEFSKEQARIFENFSYRIIAISAIILLGVGTSLIQVFNALEDGRTFIAVIWMVMAIVHAALAFFFFRPHDNFLKITVTEGNDIGQLMTALEELNFAFLIFLILDTFIITISLLSDLGVF